MTEAIHIQKDVPTAHWRINPRIKKNSSQLIRPSPRPQITSPTDKRKILDQFSNHLVVSTLPGAELAIEYLYSKYIRNLSIHTIRQTGGVVLSFLQFLHSNKTTIFTLTRRDIGSFVEYEQDRGLRPISIIGYLRALYAFIAYLVKEEILPHEIMQRKIRIQEPETLPKAIPKEDIQLLLDAIASVRDRALILLLLRTGMRIGELLEVQINDIVLSDRKILIYLGTKNYQGRAVYFSEDAEHALKHWLRIRDDNKRYLFYGTPGEQLSYSTAWGAMRKTLERAGLVHKKYSLHSLRHTFATDMINAGMRVEVLQKLLGHQSIELTMRYAKLSAKTREQDYFRAMQIIEQGGPSDEPYRVSNALQKVFEEKKLLQPHDKNYLNRLKHFLVWLPVPVELAEPVHVKHYIDTLLEKRLGPQTINGHLVAIRGFYYYLLDEEELTIANPAVRGLALRLPDPLPRHLQDHQVATFFSAVTKKRDLAMFMLMLRCGLRVEEVANLTLGTIDYGRNQIMVRCGKGAKDRIVFINIDAADALAAYLQIRPRATEQRIFLVEKGVYKGKPISVRGIQKRVEYYSRKSGIPVSCHQLRHTMASQLLNAGADVVTLQYLLGHRRIKTTMRYARLSNQKARSDYYLTMNKVEEKSGTTVTWNVRC